MTAKMLVALAAVAAVALMVVVSGCPPQHQEAADTSGAPAPMKKGEAKKAETPTPAAAAGGIQAKGSDTLLQVAQALAEAYKKQKPNLPISVTGGGSGTGFQACEDGTCDIADASRKIKDEEVKACKAKGIEVVENLVGYDGIAVIVNKNNPIEKLTIDQVSDLYVGTITDWKTFGGKGEVVLLSRDSSSGTFQYFKEEIIQKGDSKSKRDYAATAQRLPSTTQIRDQVAATENAIGYIGMGYINDSVKVVPIVDKHGKAIKPTLETVRSKTYPISRPLFMYTRKDTSPDVVAYLAWITGPEGQAIVQKEGFVPVK